MPFVAFLDACVLFPPNLRDVILTIAEAGICQIRWSPDVLDEMERNIIKKAKFDHEKAESGVRYLRGVMENAFPDAMVEQGMYSHLITVMPNDPKDRHVLAAAIACRADLLVTANIKDFSYPPDFCQVEIQHPDDFLRNQLELAPKALFETLKELASQRHTPMNSVRAILESLHKTVPNFAMLAFDLLPQFESEKTH